MGTIPAKCKFECCVCGRSVGRVEDLRTKSPLDAIFLQRHGRYQDTRYYASSRVLTNVGFCSDKCFSKKLVPQVGGSINVAAISERLNSDSRQKLVETFELNPEASVQFATLEIITPQRLSNHFSKINEEPQSFLLDTSVIIKCIGRGPGKSGTLYYKKFPEKFAGHVIGACSLTLDDGGSRGVAITSVVFFVADFIEFSGRHSLDLDGSEPSSPRDLFDDVV